MKLLAIDTSTLTAGVAAWDDRLVAERRQRVTTHSEALMGMVDAVLTEAGWARGAIDGVVCAAGPGSFTGLRIGLATAKGLCFALGKPLALISSLEALAARAPEGSRACAVLDAHKDEVYAAEYTISDGQPRSIGPELVLSPAQLSGRLLDAGTLWLVGDGALRYAAAWPANATPLDDDGAPRPIDLARLGAARLSRGEHDPLDAPPRYIRASEAEIAKAKLKGNQ
jgi:tRNA threonylcarbamoyladenosine biosynthesis protein TsaB